MLAECLRTGYCVTSPCASCCLPFSGASHFKPFFIQARSFWVRWAACIPQAGLKSITHSAEHRGVQSEPSGDGHEGPAVPLSGQ